MRYKTLILSIVVCLISVCVFLYYADKENTKVRVTGTVLGTTSQLRSPYKSTQIYTDYYIAVHPDNTELYKDFTTEVDFLTVTKFNKGDKITFPNISQSIVLKHPVCYFWTILFSIIIGIFSFSIAFVEFLELT